MALYLIVVISSASTAFAQQSTDVTAVPIAAVPSDLEPQVPSVLPTVIAPELAQGSRLGPAPTARGQGAPLSPTPPAQERQWYGWQTLIADALSIGAISAGLVLDSSYVGLPGVGGYLFGAPTVHWYRGEVGRGFASFGIRFAAAALTVVGGAACVATAFGGNSAVCIAPIVGVIMVPASIAIDAAVLSWETAPVETSKLPTLSPWFSAERRAGGFIWQGTF